MERHMRKMQVFLVIVVLLFAALVHAKTASEVFDSVSSSIVVIRTYDASGKSMKLGSGVAIASELIATNCHVIKDAAKIHVVRQGQEYLAAVRHSDWDRDVCTLTVSGINAPAVVTGTTNHLKVGARVYAIGAPKGLELTLSEGIISSLRPVEGGQYLQITAPISPGSSGGGLFDEEGRLIGLPTFYLSEGQQLNFAVPVEWISELPKRHKKEVEPEQTTTIDWLHKAAALTEKKDWAGLLAHSLRWTKAQPEVVAAWVFLGFAYGQSGQRAKEIESYQQVLRIDPENANAWRLLGLVYRQSDQAGKAIESFQQEVRIDPENAEAWSSLGEAYVDSGQTAKAIESIQRALRIDPEYAGAWFSLGGAYAKSHQTAKAIEAFKHALRIDPENANAWCALGIAYWQSGQTAKEIESYQQALRLNPEYAHAWLFLGNAYGRSGQRAKQIESYQHVVRIDPENAKAWGSLGIAYAESNQTTKAIEAIKQVVRIEPKEPKSWYLLGLLYNARGEKDQVMEVYKRLKTLDPAQADKFFNDVILP
jgi:tetratricopeptide (TPR) repeat protein